MCWNLKGVGNIFTPRFETQTKIKISLFHSRNPFYKYGALHLGNTLFVVSSIKFHRKHLLQSSILSYFANGNELIISLSYAIGRTL